jgi:hypothetical protein
MAGRRGKKGGRKSAGKTKTTVKRGKASVNRMKKASNSCCPIIYKICTPVTKKVTKWVSDGGDYGAERTEKVNVGTRCRVDFGKRSFGGKGRGKLSPEDADKKVKELTDTLTAKRCQALVLDTKKKPKPAAKAAVDMGWNIPFFD